MPFLIPAGEIILFLLGLGLLVPVSFLLLEILAAEKLPVLDGVETDGSPATAVILIPAHDEAAGIGATLEAVLRGKSDNDTVLVIADNCTDETAQIARRRNIAVIERHDPVRRGKGYALAFGLAQLAHEPPAVVHVLDADCVPAPGAFQHLKRRVMETGRPVQAVYRWQSLAASSPLQALSNFAFLVKNVVRPMGLRRLQGPCLLNGSGMAFPWAVLENISLAHAHLVEDVWLGVELTCAGHAPVYCPEAVVYSNPPRQTGALMTQRRRWERGQLGIMRHGIPRLLLCGVRERRADALWLALELSVPPLALLVLVTVLLGVLALPGLVYRYAGGTPEAGWWLAPLNLVLLSVAVFTAWFKYARVELPVRVLLAAPVYVAWKIPMYLRVLVGGRPQWERTEREHVSVSPEGKV